MSKEIVLEVRDDISEKILFFHIFSYYFLASGALVLVSTVIADNKPMELCYRCYIIFLITYFLMPIILKYIDI